MQSNRRHFLQQAASTALAATGMSGPVWAVGPRVSVVGTQFARLFEPAPGAGAGIAGTSPGGGLVTGAAVAGPMAASPGTSAGGSQPARAPGARGLAVDVLEAILLPAGIRPVYEFYPWARAQAMIEQGPGQILVGPYRTPERERRMRFSREPFYEDALVFYARKGQQQLWRNDFAALQGLKVGAVQGWVYGDRFEQARGQMPVSVVRDLATALRMLQLGRLDLIAANQRNSEPVINELGLTDMVQVCSPAFGQLRGHFAFGLDAAGRQWQTLIDAGMQRLRSSGELGRMAARNGVQLPPVLPT